MSDGIYHFKLGDFSCTVFRDAIDTRPLEFLTTSVSTEEVSQALISLGLPGDQVVLSYNILLLERGGERTLIDSGLMQIEGRQGELLKHLREEGIEPETIKRVIITHMDYDHVGGLMSANGDLFYKEAQILLTREAWDWYASETVLAKIDPKVADFFRKLFPVIADHVVFVEGDQELIPGVRTISTPGHRAGHIALWKSLPRGKHFFISVTPSTVQCLSFTQTGWSKLIRFLRRLASRVKHFLPEPPHKTPWCLRHTPLFRVWD